MNLQAPHFARREEPERLEQRPLAGVELVLAHAGVHDEDVRRGLRAARLWDRVVDGAVVGEQLRREVALGYRIVVRGELVPRVAERTHPKLPGEVHARKRIQHRTAAAARHGLVRNDL